MCLCCRQNLLQHKKQGIRQTLNHNNSERVKILTVSKNFFPLLQVEYRKSPQIKCNSFLLYLYWHKIKTKLPIQYSLTSLAIIFTIWEIVFFFLLPLLLLRSHTTHRAHRWTARWFASHFTSWCFLQHHRGAGKGRPLTQKSSQLCGDAELDANWRVSATDREVGPAGQKPPPPPPSLWLD